MSDVKNTLFCFGHGYCCDYLGHALTRDSDWRMAGTTRDSEKRADLRARGVEAHIFDSRSPLVDAPFILRDVTHLLISTPPSDSGDPTFLMHAEDIARLSNLKWVGYLSTTGVYGDQNGAWVDESVKRNPDSQRGSRRALAEEQWLSLAVHYDLPVHIFRLAGIYGPGRSALDSVRAGIARRIDKPGHVFNRVHVEDIVEVLLASMRDPQAGRIYNVCDDEAAPSHEVIEYACELLGQALPPLVDFEDADISPMARSFYRDHKRVSNTRIREELGVDLKYKNFREGLKGCLEAEEYALSNYSHSA